MKSKFYPTTALLALMAMVVMSGCQKVEPVEPLSGDASINVSASILSAQTAPLNAQTRATAELPTASKASFANGDNFSLYISRSIDALKLQTNVMRGADYSNIKYSHNGTSFVTTAGLPAGTIYYPYRDVNVDMWGIYPYDLLAKTKQADTYPWTVELNQSTTVNVLKSDFMVARTKNITPLASSPVNLLFEHKMARLRLEIKVPADIDGKAVNPTAPVKQIYFENTRIKGVYDFNKNIASADINAPVVSITPLARGSELVTPGKAADGTYLYYEALLVPQTLPPGSVFLRVFINYTSLPNAGLFVLELPMQYVLQSGKQHSYIVSFDSKFRLRLDGAKILDWEEASDVDHDIDEG